MPPDLGIVDRLRSFGLTVVEVDGWQTRGRTYADFAPRGSVNHHTAGPLYGDAPSLGICINGRPDLPGPLCNVFGSRSLVAYVVAAGVANHAGPGGWAGLSGNQTVYGLEMENAGTAADPGTELMFEFMARVHAALIAGINGDPSLVCEHFEWSTQGKIDFHDWPGADLRSRVARISVPLPNPQPSEDIVTFTYLQRQDAADPKPVFAYFDNGRVVHIDRPSGLGYQTFEDLHSTTLGAQLRTDPFPAGYHETKVIDDGSGTERLVTIVGPGTADGLGLPK